MTSILHKQALAYARQGWPAFPCAPGQKKPLIQRGFKKATTDEATINDWWTRWPNANIGVATGPGSGLFVLDVDVKNGALGLQSLKELEDLYGELPATLMADTPSGGVHYFFAYPDFRVGNAVNFRPGLDVRGEGGYIVAPPSVIDGRFYRWQNCGTKLATAPPWLLDIITKPRPSGPGASAVGLPTSPLQGVPEGSRNDTIFKYACSLRTRGISKAEARALILIKAADCAPPMDETEALRCLDSAYTRYPPGRQRALTDSGNAERLEDHYEDNLRFVPAYSQWLIWNGTHWKWDTLEEVYGYAKAVVRSIPTELPEGAEENVRAAHVKHARRSEQAPALRNMILLASKSRKLAIKADELDADDWLFGVANGVVDLKSGSYRPATRHDYVTKHSQVPFEVEARCPRWESFVFEITGNDAELATFLHRCIGYILIGGNPAQVIFILWGMGANGKSTLINVVKALLGSYARAVESALFAHTFHTSGSPREDIARLKDARFVHTTELTEGSMLDEDLVKRMTGDDILAARVPYGKSTIEFRPKFTPWMATNHKPIIRNNDYGIWRRIVLIPFTQTFGEKQRDEALPQTLEAELPGILNWALTGLKAYREGGLQIPQSVRDAVKENQTDMDLLGEWMEEACELIPEAWTPTGDLYGNYWQWCVRNYQKHTYDRKVFGRKLGSRGLKAEKQKGKRGFLGIGLTGQAESTPPLRLASG